MGTIRNFLSTSPFAQYLETCWSGKYYCNFPIASPSQQADQYDVSGTNAHALLYLTYTHLLNLPEPNHVNTLADWLADHIDADGLCICQNELTDHPAAISNVVDALATACYYADAVGLSAEVRAKCLAAIIRVGERHPRIRAPQGNAGRSQQLRFELRIFYWLALLDDAARWRPQFAVGLREGLHNYCNPVALEGGLLQPSLHPDWTWNYACSSGVIDRYATNTHTPAYYCTEPNGFMFVYLHGLRQGLFDRDQDLDNFCRNFIYGLIRNFSRAGHLSSDLDGYGIHRAWYAPVLCEGLPVEATALAHLLDMGEWTNYLRWYIDRFIGFIKRQPDYPVTGLPSALPYKHKIGIENQFSFLATARVYASLARGLYDFPGLDAITAAMPPAFAAYAWQSEWLRISTPVYETSFVGHSSLRHVPVVPKYGDAFLGTLVGGCPLTTMMSGESLLYAASFPVAALWHIEVDDHDGRRQISCATGPDDERFMTVQFGQQPPRDLCSYNPYERPEVYFFAADSKDAKNCVAVNYQRRERRQGLCFYVHNRYCYDYIDLDFGVIGQAGFYYDRISFVIALPSEQLELIDADSAYLPTSIRWRTSPDGNFAVIQQLTLSGDVSDLGKVSCTRLELPMSEGYPGGKQCFSPHQSGQLCIEIVPSTSAHCWRLRGQLRFVQV